MYKVFKNKAQGCSTPLTAHNWQKWKSRFLACPCHKIYRVELIGLSPIMPKNNDFCEYAKFQVISWNFDILLITALGVTSGCILPIDHSVLLPWIQTSLSSKIEIVFIRIKVLFEPIVLLRKADWVLLFLKAFSWETDLLVTPGDFTVKTQNWEGNWKSI